MRSRIESLNWDQDHLSSLFCHMSNYLIKIINESVLAVGGLDLFIVLTKPSTFLFNVLQDKRGGPLLVPVKKNNLFIKRHGCLVLHRNV